VVLRADEVGALVGASLAAWVPAAQEITSIVLRADAGVAKVAAGEGPARVAAAIGIADQVIHAKKIAFVGTILVAGIAPGAKQIAIWPGVAAWRTMVLRTDDGTFVRASNVTRAAAAQQVAVRISAERLAVVLRTDRAASVGTVRPARSRVATDVAPAAAALRRAERITEATRGASDRGAAIGISTYIERITNPEAPLGDRRVFGAVHPRRAIERRRLFGRWILLFRYRRFALFLTQCRQRQNDTQRPVKCEWKHQRHPDSFRNDVHDFSSHQAKHGPANRRTVSAVPIYTRFPSVRKQDGLLVLYRGSGFFQPRDLQNDLSWSISHLTTRVFSPFRFR